MSIAHDKDQDALARALAANAGVDWDRLCNYPGYIKTIWREQAGLLRDLMGEQDSGRRPPKTPPR